MFYSHVKIIFRLFFTSFLKDLFRLADLFQMNLNIIVRELEFENTVSIIRKLQPLEANECCANVHT